MVTRWSVFDPVTNETLNFSLNPSSGELPQLEKPITSRATVAPLGKAVIFEGQAEPVEFSFSGVLFESDDYDWFLTWYNKKYQVKLTDDLGNEAWVYLTKFSPKRRRSFHHEWCVDYDATVLVIDWE